VSYRFATAAQWSVCLFDGADRAAAGLRPYAPYSPLYTLYASRGGHAPVVTSGGEVLWRDDAHELHRLDGDPVATPFAIGHAARLVATRRGLWAVGEPPLSLQLFEWETLARLLTVEIGGARVIDISDDGRGGVFALVERAEGVQIVPVDCAGRLGDGMTLDACAPATAFVYLRRADRFVVLGGERPPSLFWFRRKNLKLVPAFNLPVAALRPCFTATVLGSDGRSRLFIAGADDASFGGSAFVIALDADGNRLEDVPLDARDAPATGVAGTRESLIVTGPRGLLRFVTAETVPDGVGEARATLITPVLYSPDRPDARRWLRIEASSKLPDGATLEISFAAPEDQETRDEMTSVFGDASLTPAQRVRKLRSDPTRWQAPVVFHGSDSQQAAPFSAPLFDIHQPYVWVAITLSAAAGARLPDVSELNVLYPGGTLMENLPAIYQRAETEPGSFLRALVGVLETTTQEIDGEIKSIGRHIDPSTASEPWLDYVARWLGVPWDDGLTLPLKQRIMSRAANLAKGRGTRAGLEALLDALMPGMPRRFRVTDATADFGFATVGGDGCSGSALPAMLGGRTRWAAELNSRAVLGYMRLPCAGQLDDGVGQLAGRIRVDVAASAEERAEWEPWLLALIKSMVPLSARVELHWASALALRGDRLDGTLTLEAPPMTRLGTDALTGMARLPERGLRLSASGSPLGTSLR